MHCHLWSWWFCAHLPVSPTHALHDLLSSHPACVHRPESYCTCCAGQGSQPMTQHLQPAGGARESSPWNPLYRDSPRTAISPQVLTMDKWLMRPQAHGHSAEQQPGGYESAGIWS